MSTASSAVTPMMVAGGGTSLFLNSDGTVWGTGSVPNTGPGVVSPRPVFQLPNVVAIGGVNPDFAVLADGSVWAVGINGVGQLGDGTTQNRSSPTQLPGLSGVKAVAAGDSGFAIALKNDGTVWAWGKNDGGQLGDGTTTDHSQPAPVSGLTNVVRISASGASALALKADGTVWVWGVTWGSGLGNGATNIGVGDPGWNQLVPSQVLSLNQVVAISTGGTRHLVLRADGTVWTWGTFFNGEDGLGIPGVHGQALPVKVPNLDHVVAIEANGAGLSLALKSDGSVWAWGINNYGQLGVSGSNESTIPVQVPGLSDIAAIAAGDNHALAMRRDGTVLAWGQNNNGQLGDNTLRNRATPQPMVGPGASGQLNLLLPAPASFNRLPGAQISLSASSGTAPLTVQATAINAADPDGSVSAFYWMSNRQQATGPSASFVYTQAGQYNIDLLVEDNTGARGHRRAQVEVARAATAPVSVSPKVVVGYNASMAVANDGKILIWGSGFGPTPLTHPVAPGITGAVDVAVGSYHTLALLADGTALGQGGNNFGQTGTGNPSNTVPQPGLIAGLPPAQAIVAGGQSSFALTRDGRVFAWGDNSAGMLGLGDFTHRFTATEVGGLTNVTAIAVGPACVAALKADGTVWAWGQNSTYQLGDGTTAARNAPIRIPGLSGVTKIFGTANNLIAIRTDGSAWATGNFPVAIAGDSGPSAGARRVALFDGALQIAGSWWDFAVLKSDGTVWTGGTGTASTGFDSGEVINGLQQLAGVTDAIQVTAGANNYLVLRRDGTVLSWGFNANGALGNGTLAFQRTPDFVINENANGYLDLIPEVANLNYSGKVAPFITTVVADGSIVAARPTITNTTRFNSVDIGKTGAVFVTAMVPAGQLATAQDATDRRVALRSTIAESGSGAFVRVQLTPNGWQQVINGQLIPYASGVLGDQLAAQTILSGTDTSNLKGAEFCVGYGTSAEEMNAAGRMKAIVSIPDANGTNTISCLVVAAQAVRPQSGWWWNPAESGRGFSIEVSGNLLFLATYLYDGSGRAAWYVTSGALNTDGSYNGSLLQFGNGQPLTGTYRAPVAKGSAGTIAIRCSTTTTCTLNLAGGAVPIQRFTWEPSPALAGSPETGWWWNPSESGRGYFLEQQGGTLFVSGYLYDAAGNDIWYIGSGARSSGLFSTNWSEFGNGQTLAGSYRAPSVVNGNVGSLKIDFSNSTEGQLTFPDGRVVQISRYRF